MNSSPDDGSEVVVSILNVTAQTGETPGQFVVTLETNHGDIEAVFLPCEGKTGCLIFIGDEGAEGVYRQLSEDLVASGVTSLRLRPRVPGEFTDTLIDTLAACSFLKGLGGEAAVIVGHSYAGAVAVRAGTISPFARAVAALAPQRYGTQGVEEMRKPLLLIHGADDDVLPPLASEDVFQRAQEPKQMVIIDGTGHSFAGKGERLYELLSRFVTEQVGEYRGA